MNLFCKIALEYILGIVLGFILGRFLYNPRINIKGTSARIRNFSGTFSLLLPITYVEGNYIIKSPIPIIIYDLDGETAIIGLPETPSSIGAKYFDINIDGRILSFKENDKIDLSSFYNKDSLKQEWKMFF